MAFSYSGRRLFQVGNDNTTTPTSSTVRQDLDSEFLSSVKEIRDLYSQDSRMRWIPQWGRNKSKKLVDTIKKGAWNVPRSQPNHEQERAMSPMSTQRLWREQSKDLQAIMEKLSFPHSDKASAPRGFPTGIPMLEGVSEVFHNSKKSEAQARKKYLENGGDGPNISFNGAKLILPEEVNIFGDDKVFDSNSSGYPPSPSHPQKGHYLSVKSQDRVAIAPARLVMRNLANKHRSKEIAGFTLAEAQMDEEEEQGGTGSPILYDELEEDSFPSPVILKTPVSGHLRPMSVSQSTIGSRQSRRMKRNASQNSVKQHRSYASAGSQKLSPTGSHTTLEADSCDQPNSWSTRRAERLFFAGLNSERLGANVLACSYYEEARKMYPRHVAALHAQVDLLMRLKEYPAVISLIEKNSWADTKELKEALQLCQSSIGDYKPRMHEVDLGTESEMIAQAIEKSLKERKKAPTPYNPFFDNDCFH